MVVRVEPDHGTRARYVHRTFHCRCTDCRKSNTAYIARYRRERGGSALWHEPRLPGIG
jgi:hypothetical protein